MDKQRLRIVGADMRPICPICDTPLKRRSHKFCSRACYGVSKKQRVTVVCTGCSAPFELRPFEAKRSECHYCADCRALWTERSRTKRKPTGYTLDCFNCGTPCYRPLWRSKRYVYTFCSTECRRAGWHNLRLAWEALNWGKTKEEGTEG